MLEKELAVRNAEEREKEHEDGEFKADTETEDDRKEELGVVLDGDHVGEVFADVLDQEGHGPGEHPAIAEPCPC